MDARPLVFCLENHPLDDWMSRHGPLLQALAAQRHLTEQLLSSVAVSAPMQRSQAEGEGEDADDDASEEGGAASEADDTTIAAAGDAAPPAGLPGAVTSAGAAPALALGTAGAPRPSEDSQETRAEHMEAAVQQAHRDLAAMYMARYVVRSPALHCAGGSPRLGCGV